MSDWARFELAACLGDYVRALDWLGSEDVAAGILELDSEWPLDDNELRAVLREHWDCCDGGGPHRDDFLELFRRVGFVTDTGRTFTGELVAYRGNLGEDPRLGISWTLSRRKARWFALYALDSPRARWLGLTRSDGSEPVATVWRCTVNAADVLGYFGCRRESELVLDPSSVREVELVLRPYRRAT